MTPKKTKKYFTIFVGFANYWPYLVSSFTCCVFIKDVVDEKTTAAVSPILQAAFST